MLVFAVGIRTIRGILLPAGFYPPVLTRLYIASQMGHGNAQRVYEVYGAWIEEMNGEQVLMLNDKLAR